MKKNYFALLGSALSLAMLCTMGSPALAAEPAAPADYDAFETAGVDPGKSQRLPISGFTSIPPRTAR